RAIAKRDVDMARRVPSAARLGIWSSRKEEIAVERTSVHAQRRLLVVKTQRRPLCARLQSPSHMRNRIDFAIAERVHIRSQKISIKFAVDLVDVAILDRKHDRRLHVGFKRQQNITAVNYDRAARRLFIRPRAQKSARPVVPPTRLIGESILL